MSRDGSGPAAGREGDRGPVRLSRTVSVLAGLGSVGAAGWYSGRATLVGAAGLAVVALGLYLHRRRGVLLGAIGLFLAVVIAGTDGAPESALLVGVVGVTVAWDAGENALSLGAQVGRRGRSVRAQAVHLAGTAGVAGLTAVGGYAVYRVATGGQPVSALLLLLLAGALLVAALSE